MSLEGRPHLIEVDNVKIFPRIRAITGHTRAAPNLGIMGIPTDVIGC
jgi:hypothetical protein